MEAGFPVGEGGVAHGRGTPSGPGPGVLLLGGNTYQVARNPIAGSQYSYSGRTFKGVPSTFSGGAMTI